MRYQNKTFATVSMDPETNSNNRVSVAADVVDAAVWPEALFVTRVWLVTR